MLRQVKVARDVAVKARTVVIITLKTLVVTAPEDPRAQTLVSCAVNAL